MGAVPCLHKGLGAPGLHQQVPHEGRVSHLKNGLDRTNEADVRDEIPWGDIDTMYVETPMLAKATQMIDAAKRAGKVPGGLRVREAGATRAATGPAMVDRANELNDSVG